MAQDQKSYDQYNFVAGDAVAASKPIELQCKCGGLVTVVPPLQQDYATCPKCGLTIGMVVIAGDPGFMVATPPGGKPKLYGVRGSTKPHPDTLSSEERERILAQWEQANKSPKQ